MNNRRDRAAVSTDVRGRVYTLPRGVFWIFYGGRVMKFLKNTGRQKILLEYFYIIAGTAIMAFSVNWFMDPANMVPGGFTGIALIINRSTAKAWGTGIPVGVVTLCLNIPLVILGVRIRGWNFIKRSFVGAVCYSLWLIVLPAGNPIGDDIALAAVTGGVLTGVGLGFVLAGKGTTGGTDTVAALIQKSRPHLSTAMIFPVLDGIVIAFAMGILGVIPSLYAAISVFISGKVSDWAMTATKDKVSEVFIVTEKFREISNEIIHTLDRGATLLHGDGMYSGGKKPVLLCAVKKRQTMELRDIVYSIDPGAFMIISDAKDVRGEGFMPPMEETL